MHPTAVGIPANNATMIHNAERRITKYPWMSGQFACRGDGARSKWNASHSPSVTAWAAKIKAHTKGSHQ